MITLEKLDNGNVLINDNGVMKSVNGGMNIYSSSQYYETVLISTLSGGQNERGVLIPFKDIDKANCTPTIEAVTFEEFKKELAESFFFKLAGGGLGIPIFSPLDRFAHDLESPSYFSVTPDSLHDTGAYKKTVYEEGTVFFSDGTQIENMYTGADAVTGNLGGTISVNLGRAPIRIYKNVLNSSMVYMGGTRKRMKMLPGDGKLDFAKSYEFTFWCSVFQGGSFYRMFQIGKDDTANKKSQANAVDMSLDHSSISNTGRLSLTVYPNATTLITDIDPEGTHFYRIVLNSLGGGDYDFYLFINGVQKHNSVYDSSSLVFPFIGSTEDRADTKANQFVDDVQSRQLDRHFSTDPTERYSTDQFYDKDLVTLLEDGFYFKRGHDDFIKIA